MTRGNRTPARLVRQAKTLATRRWLAAAARQVRRALAETRAQVAVARLVQLVAAETRARAGEARVVQPGLPAPPELQAQVA